MLFDLSSTFSYVSTYYVARLGITPEPLSSLIQISASVGDSPVVYQVCRGYVITLKGFDNWVDLILLDMLDFDLIFLYGLVGPTSCCVRLLCQDCYLGDTRDAPSGLAGCVS